MNSQGKDQFQIDTGANEINKQSQQINISLDDQSSDQIQTDAIIVQKQKQDIQSARNQESSKDPQQDQYFHDIARESHFTTSVNDSSIIDQNTSFQFESLMGEDLRMDKNLKSNLVFKKSIGDLKEMNYAQSQHKDIDFNDEDLLNNEAQNAQEKGNSFPQNVKIVKSDKKASNNIFGNRRSISKAKTTEVQNQIHSIQDLLDRNQDLAKKERNFEKQCQTLIKHQKWEELDKVSTDHLEETHGISFKGFFYLGISFYKIQDYHNAIRAFQKAELINGDDSQLQYSLGLANFKIEQYNQAVDHLKKCTQIDPKHPFAYNNLAFLYNMHQYYHQTITVCGLAKQNNPDKHNCYRHWAFALYKMGKMAKAVKKIKKGIQKNSRDPENWIIWGLILRTVGNYASAKHKFKRALKYDKSNQTALEELKMLEKIIEIDKTLPLEQVPSVSKRANTNRSLKKQADDFDLGIESGKAINTEQKLINNLSSACTRSCSNARSCNSNHNNCTIF
eukprot:403348846